MFELIGVQQGGSYHQFLLQIVETIGVHRKSNLLVTLLLVYSAVYQAYLGGYFWKLLSPISSATPGVYTVALFQHHTAFIST